MLNPVRTVLFVIRPCVKQFKIRSCMLQSVKVQVPCTSALTVRTPSSPGFVEWSMLSDAWVDTTELSGEKKKEQSPDTVREEPTEPAPGTVIAQVEQQDVEKDPSEPREETRRVVLVTMEPEESTEVIVKPPEQEPEGSTEATEKPSEPVEKEKGLEMEKRESEVPKDLPEPEIPEKPFVETEKAQEATSEQEVTFRMKAWSNWLHRQDQKDEEKRIRNRARQRALRQQDRAAGLQQAVRKGPSLGGRPTTEGVSPEGVETSHQSTATRADCKAAIDRERGSGLQSHSQGRVHDPKQAPRLDRSQSASAAEVIGISCEKGVYRDPAPDRFGSLRCWRPGRDSRSSSRECSDPDQRSKEHFVRLNRPRADNIRNSGAYKRGCTGTSIGATTGHKAWNRLLHEEKARGAGEREVHVPGPSVVATFEQRRVVGHGCLHFWIGSSRSSSPDLDRREFTASRNSQKDPEANPILAANEGEGQTGGTPTPAGSTPGVAGSSGRQTGGDGRSGSCQAEGASESGKRRSGENVGSDCPDGNSGAENSIGSGTKNATETTDETQSEIATAHRRAKSGGRRGVSSKSQRPPQGSRPQEGYRDPRRGEAVHGIRIKCQESTEVPDTSDRRGAREAFSIRAGIRETGRSDRMGEGTQPSSERRGRTPKGEGAVPFREDGTSLRTWKGGSASPAGRVRERKTRSPAMEGRRRRSREFEKGKTNFSRATRSATDSGRSSSDTSAKGNVGTDGDGGGESRYAARSASSAIVRGRDCVPQATAGASVQVFGQEGRREVGRDVRSVGREGRHDIQSVQVPPKRGVEPPIRARAHFLNPAFDVARKKEIVCTVESEPEFEFEYPIKLRGNRLAKHILQSHTPYDPSCAVCLMSKGLKRAPKRTDQVSNEIQMDIANLCTHPKSPNMYRYVVMWNRTHGMIATAAIYVDQASTIRVLTAAINHCSSTGAMVLSDEGRDLTALISELIRLKVVSRHETSRPGRHATGAERAVRTLKTQLGCIRTVLYQHGLMLGSESLRYAAANACHVHNAFQLQANSSLTPYQRMRISVTSSGEVPNNNRVMPFGCLVFARPTDGYLEKVREANARHFVPGIYLTPKLSSLGHFVAFEGSQDETVVVPVRDLKIASPIRFVAGLGMLCEIPNSKSGVKPDRIERLPNDLSKPQKLVDLPIHEGEPPWYIGVK